MLDNVHAFIQACNESGIPFEKDYNNGVEFGCAYIQSIQKNGRRCSAEKAFLKPTRNRRNLEVKTDSRVTKILINPDTKLAEGVTYERRRYIKLESYKVRARKEVILSAGAIGSPQLLMLSGIGPEEHLQKLGIDVVHDLPVGKVLSNHVSYTNLVWKVDKHVTMTASDLLNPVQIGNYLLHGKGPYTISSLLAEGIAFIRTDEADHNSTAPDVELIFASGSYITDFGLVLRNEFRLGNDAFRKIYWPLFGKNTFQFLSILLHPISKGYLELNSSDPYDSPKLYGNFLSDLENKDIKTMISAIRVTQKIGNCPAFKKYGAEQILTPVQGCEEFENDSDEFWECQVRHLSIGFWHESSTCKMGPKEDPMAIVDSELKVHGISKLRVADISIMPSHVSGHTTAPAFMIGEKLADMILSL